jgi:hypothetical protein
MTVHKAISTDYLESLPASAPVPMSPEEAAAELVRGAVAGHYGLPPDVLRVASGTEDLRLRAQEARALLSGRFGPSWEAGLAAKVAADVRNASWAEGRVPSDVAAPILTAQEEHRRVAAEADVLGKASESAESAPVFVTRQAAPAIAAALEAARAEVLAAAREPSRHIVDLDLGDPGAVMAVPKASQAAYSTLLDLLPRWNAVLRGCEALRALAPAQAPSWPASSGGHPVAALAKEATS